MHLHYLSFALDNGSNISSHLHIPLDFGIHHTVQLLQQCRWLVQLQLLQLEVWSNMGCNQLLIWCLDTLKLVVQKNRGRCRCHWGWGSNSRNGSRRLFCNLWWRSIQLMRSLSPIQVYIMKQNVPFVRYYYFKNYWWEYKLLLL